MEARRRRVLLFFATFCVVILLGLGFYLITPTVPGETVTSQVTITTRTADTGTSYLTASVAYTISSYTSLCNHLGCSSLTRTDVIASTSTAIAPYTSTQLLVTTSSSEATLASHAMSQAGGISVIVAAFIVAATLMASWKRRVQPSTSFRNEQTSARRRSTIPIKPNVQFCDHCGTRIPLDSTFCEECGASLKSDNVCPHGYDLEQECPHCDTSPAGSIRDSGVNGRFSRDPVPWDGSRAKADYSGRCPRCHRRINLGDEITWWKDKDDDVKWIHLKCR
jgi:hypothetical protein